MKAKDLEKFIKSLKDESIQDLSFFAWQVARGQIEKIPLTLASINSPKKIISFRVNNFHKKTLEEFVSGSGMIHLYCQQKGLIFRSELIFLEKEVLNVSYPGKIEEIDRRDGERIDPLFPVLIEFDGLVKECLDISERGFSIVLNNHDKKEALKKGEELKDVRIRFFLYETKVNLKIRSIRNVKKFEFEKHPYGKLRISFEILNPPDLYIIEINKLKKGAANLIKDLV